MPAADLSLSEARRIVLAAQGLDRSRPTVGPGPEHVRRTIRRLGLLQIDFVNVLVPAHYLVLYSRLGPYRKTLLDDLVYRKREFTEQWGRAASIVPIETWALFGRRLEIRERRARALDAFMNTHRAYAADVLRRVRVGGPLTAGEVLEPDGSRGKRGTWWGWTLAKSTLEAHFARGTLAVAGRREGDFARLYDLTERVVPPEHRGTATSREETLRTLLLLAARASGVATAGDLADYFRLPVRDVRGGARELAREGKLREVRVEGWQEKAYLHPEAKLPSRAQGAALLSPFDPLVWYRPRVERLFGFDYRLEIFFPKPDRRWGYYVLPFLLGERLVARVDLKADRTERRLLVPAAYREAHADPVATPRALADELRALAGWLGLESVRVAGKGNLARPLAARLRS